MQQKDVTSIADFIGQFEHYGHIPDLFKKIGKESTQVVTCRFLLAADAGADGKIEQDQYYGLRSDMNERKNCMFRSRSDDDRADGANDKAGKLYEALRTQLLNDEELHYSHSKESIKYWMDFAEDKFKGEGYTAAWHEWVGIDPEGSRTEPGGCIFQVDVETELDRPPMVCFRFLTCTKDCCKKLTFDSYNTIPHTNCTTMRTVRIWPQTFPRTPALRAIPSGSCTGLDSQHAYRSLLSLKPRTTVAEA